MTYLLDVNVLIALIDPTHVSHDDAHRWFEREGREAWATCPLTENGVIRIVGHARYPNSPGPPAVVAQIIERLRTLAGHVFWPDDISVLDRDRFHTDQLLSSPQVTDSYLLALALAHDGKLATLDRHLSVKAVRNGKDGLRII